MSCMPLSLSNATRPSTATGRGLAMILTFLVILLLVSGARAQSAPFQVLGQIESFKLDPTLCPAEPAAFQGGTMVVNGQAIVIPCYTVLVMPARYLTPKQLFDRAPAVHLARAESGLALRDLPAPLAAFEVAIDGNIVCAPACRHLAGQVHISQQSLNNGAGFIHAIDMSVGATGGEMCVGSNPVPTLPPTCQPGDARVRLNDPCTAWDQAAGLPYPSTCAGPGGRYGAPNAAQPAAGADPNSQFTSRYPDHRFQVDQDNPTVHSLTGYPMCVRRSNADPECPTDNRPLVGGPGTAPLTTFVTSGTGLPSPAAGLPPIAPCVAGCNARLQAPLMPGDYINYQGTLAARADLTAPTDATKNIIYISAHTVVANVGIYTQQSNGDPVYVTLEGSLIGTRGNTTVAASPLCTRQMECQDRIKLEGFLTDPSVEIHVYAVDAPPATTPMIRLLGPAVKKAAGGVPFGRFRFVTQKLAGVLFNRAGVQMGATRELLAVVGPPPPAGAAPPPGAPPMLPGESAPMPSLPVIANGLLGGQFQAPVGEYIFPEPLNMGGVQPLLNIQCLAFAGAGWRLASPTTTVDFKPLIPWPGSTAASPGISCLTPG